MQLSLQDIRLLGYRTIINFYDDGVLFNKNRTKVKNTSSHILTIRQFLMVDKLYIYKGYLNFLQG